jgi:hypothetical protein
MAFWIGILIAAGFAYSAIKLGFYHAWTMLFNIVVAVYLGIQLGPVIEEFVPAANSQYCRTLAVLAVGTGTFLILHGISYVFLIGQFEVTFPHGLNTLGSGLLGFLAGFLMWSFAVLVICTTPFCENVFVKEVGFDGKTFEEAKMQPYLVWWCSLVDRVVASGDNKGGTEQAIKDLLAKPVNRCTKGITGKPGLRAMADANEPNQLNEPNRPNRPGVERVPEPHTIIPP